MGFIYRAYNIVSRENGLLLFAHKPQTLSGNAGSCQRFVNDRSASVVQQTCNWINVILPDLIKLFVLSNVQSICLASSQVHDAPTAPDT